jgi:RNA polymerase sigma-70 factor, ECF subfamily
MAVELTGTIILVSANTERSLKFTEHLQACQVQVLRYIFALVRNNADAQDVFQKTCMVLWDKFDQFNPNQNFTAWACGVARFEVRKFLTQHRRHQARFSDDFAQRLAEIQVDSRSKEIGARQVALPGCIAKLPPSQQSLLMLCYGEHRRVADVAASLGRSVCGVHHSLRAIRERLMACIERAVREEER